MTEPGITTTEFWVAAVTALLTALIGAYAAFGGHLTPSQSAAVLAVVAPTLAIIAAAYAVVRTWRKNAGPTAPPAMTVTVNSPPAAPLAPTSVTITPAPGATVASSAGGPPTTAA